MLLDGRHIRLGAACDPCRVGREREALEVAAAADRYRFPLPIYRTAA